MQRFAGLNSIEGWNLTFQLSKLTFKTFSSLQLLKRTPYNAIINNCFLMTPVKDFYKANNSHIIEGHNYWKKESFK